MDKLLLKKKGGKKGEKQTHSRKVTDVGFIDIR